MEIAGLKSDYVSKNNFKEFIKYFPNFDIKKSIKFLDCGHFVHIEKPAETALLIHEFYNMFI